MKRIAHLKSSLIVVAIGTGLVILAFTSLLTQTTDANIGAGLLLLLGSVVVLVGLVMIIIKADHWTSKIAVLILIILLFTVNTLAFTTGEKESNRIYCEEKVAANEAPIEGVEFCEEYYSKTQLWRVKF